MNHETQIRLKHSGAEIGSLTAGLVAANILAKLTKKDTPVVNGGIALGGLIASQYVKNDLLKFGLMGVSAFGALKLVHNLVAPAAGPALFGADDLNGFLPESLKTKIRNFLPSIGSIEDEEIFRQMKGSSYEDLSGGYADLTGDDEMHGSRDTVTHDTSYEEMQGVGNADMLI